MRASKFAFVSALALWASAGTASAVTVDQEIVFMNDVSGSVDATDFNFMLTGFAEAFRDASVIAKIQSGSVGQIAVTLGFFASTPVQATPWTIISDAVSGNAFADAVEALIRPDPGIVGFEDGTSAAYDAAVSWLFGNDIDSLRQSIDIVTEGAQSIDGCGSSDAVCTTLQAARDNALIAGVDQINALVLDDRDFFGNDPADVIDAVLYAQTNMIGGSGSFVKFTEDFGGFSGAIKDKIVAEINPVPAPAALPLLASGLGAFGFMGWRRKQKAAASA